MILVVLFFVFVVMQTIRSMNRLNSKGAPETRAKRTNPQLETALAYAARLYAEHKYLASEKAYLEVIKIDHKNLSAYNHLGKIYLALKNYLDAIECYQIAAQLHPSAQAHFNTGMAFYENKNFAKAAAAFERAITFEPSSNRYLGLGRAYQRLNNLSKAIAAYEKALALDDNPQIRRLLVEAYRANNQSDKAAEAEQAKAPNSSIAESAST